MSTDWVRWVGNPLPILSEKGPHYRAVWKRLPGVDEKEQLYGVGDYVYVFSEDPQVPFIARIAALFLSNEEPSASFEWVFRPAELALKSVSLRPDEVFLSSGPSDDNLLSTILKPVRLKFMNPDTRNYEPSFLLSEGVAGTHLAVVPEYRCFRFIAHDDNLTPLTKEQFSKIHVSLQRAIEIAEDLGLAKAVVASTLVSPGSPAAPAINYPQSSSSSLTSPANSLTGVAGQIQAISLKPIANQATQSPSLPDGQPDRATPNSKVFDLALLEHGALCTTPETCVVPRCKDARNIVNHRQLCKKVECRKCSAYNGLIAEHSRKCFLPFDACKVPFCDDLKPSSIVERSLLCQKSCTCGSADCTKARNLVSHLTKGCTKPNCQSCANGEKLINLHNLGCTPNCIFPRCAHLRRTLEHSRLGCIEEDCLMCVLYSRLRHQHALICTGGSKQCKFPGHLDPAGAGTGTGRQGASSSSTASSSPGASKKSSKWPQPLPAPPPLPTMSSSGVGPRVLSPQTTALAAPRVHTIVRQPKFITAPPSHEGSSDAVITVSQTVPRSLSASPPLRSTNSSISPPPAQKKQRMLDDDGEIIHNSLMSSGGVRRAFRRIGEEFQAIIPSYSHDRPNLPSSRDLLVWSPDAQIAEFELTEALGVVRSELLKERGSIINVAIPGSKTGYWARVVRSRTEAGTIPVIPFELVWPSTRDPSSFIVPKSAWIIDVDIANVRYPETITELVMYRLFAQQSSNKPAFDPSPVRGVPEIIGSWTEEDYDEWMRSISSDSPKVRIKTDRDMYEFETIMPEGVLRPRPIRAMKCSVCLSTTNVFPCVRSYACLTLICKRCLDQDRPKNNSAWTLGKRKEESIKNGGAPDSSPDNPFCCALCRSPSVPERGQLKRIEAIVDDSHNPTRLWVRHDDVSSTRGENKLDSKSALIPPGTVRTVIRVPSLHSGVDMDKVGLNRYNEIGSVLQAYKRNELTPEEGVLLLKRILADGARNTLKALNSSSKIEESTGTGLSKLA